MKPLLALAAALWLAGCGAMALIHDAYIGPISPGGRVHPAVRGRSHGPTEGKVRTTANGRALLRPFFPRLLRRLASSEMPKRFVTRTFSDGSFFFDEVIRAGEPVDPGEMGLLQVGLTEQQVLANLGAPSLWLKRAEGSLMSYGADTDDRLTYRLGLPPIITRFIPLPGLGNLAYKHTDEGLVRHRTVLFFDREGRLVTAVQRVANVENVENLEEAEETVTSEAAAP